LALDVLGGGVDRMLVVNMPQALYFQERQLEPIAQEAGWAPGPVSRAAENLTPTRI